MQATLNFDLTTEQHEYQCAINGTKYYALIDDLLGELRILDKYSELDESQKRLLEQIRNWFNHELECVGVDNHF